MMKFLDRIFKRFDTTPEFNVVPDLTGKGLDIDYWVFSMAENKEWPQIDDVIIHVESCSMGMTVSKDTRLRVVKIHSPYKTSFLAKRQFTVPGDDLEIMHVFYLRRHKTIPRTWFMLN